jgi:hypothetical protein
VEALQLSQMERVERALVLYMIMAWLIARLMRSELSGFMSDVIA